VPAEHTSSILQLAINSSNPEGLLQGLAHGVDTPVLVAIERLNLVLQPESTRRLLATAAVRQHIGVLHELMCLPALAQHIDVGMLEIVVEQLIACAQLRLIRPYLRLSRQASDGISKRMVVRLLHAVLRSSESFFFVRLFKTLCALPAAGQINNDEAAQLLQAAKRPCSTQQAFTSLICALPAVQQSSSAALK
jgi:hypothetical protein